MKLGLDMNKVLLENPQVFDEYMKNEFNVDLKKRLAERWPSCIMHDVDFGAKMNGFDNPEEYYLAAQASNWIPKIRIPTFFLNSHDDPLIVEETIDYEVFEQNSNVCLGTTTYGGHLGYNESAFDLKKRWY